MITAFVEEKISPVLVHLMDITSVDDYRIEAITVSGDTFFFLSLHFRFQFYWSSYAFFEYCVLTAAAANNMSVNSMAV